MPLTLYGVSASRTIRPLWAATEMGIAFTHVNTPFLSGATRTPEFLALNPNGHIPVLVDTRPEGEITVWESMACTLYLARVHGVADGQSLAPANAQEEAQALRWSFWSVTELEKDALTVLMHRLAMPANQRKPELAQQAESRLRAPLAMLEGHLQTQQAQGEAFVAANRFTVADLCLASVADWIRPAGDLLASYPLTQAWLQACIKRPAYAQAKALG